MKFGIHDLLLLFLIVRKAASTDILCGKQDDPTVARRVLLKVYKGNPSNPTISQATLLTPDAIVKDIDPAKPTCIYIHGFLQNTSSKGIQAVTKAYLERNDCNVIIVDWSAIAMSLNYVAVAKSVPAVGKSIAIALQKLDPIDIKTLHIIGHSLGSHVASYIARNMPVILARLTGLDPAYPLFYPSPCSINPSNAAIVVILHTDVGVYGAPESTGTIDFYANGGSSPQPGCLLLGGELCSHQRSEVLYAESVANFKAFPAHQKSGDRMVYFNDKTPPDATGDYYFKTNSKSPFGQS